MVTPKAKAAKKTVNKAPKEVVEEATERDEKGSSSSEFDNVFYVNYIVPSRRSRRT